MEKPGDLGFSARPGYLLILGYSQPFLIAQVDGQSTRILIVTMSIPPPSEAFGGTAPPDGSPPPLSTGFTYNETDAHFLIVFGSFLTFLATISVLARLYSRYFIANHVGLDDLMAIGALVCVPDTSTLDVATNTR